MHQHAAAKNKVYGQADPVLTYTVTGLVNGDTASVLGGSLSRAVGESVGDYAIAQGSVSAGSNYSVSYTGANLSVGTAPMSLVTASSRKPSVDTYQNAFKTIKDHTLTVQASLNGLEGILSIIGSGLQLPPGLTTD